MSRQLSPGKAASSRGSRLNPAAQGSLCIVILLAINIYIIRELFFADFTNNLQNNAGSYMAIGRFILEHFPRLDWFPWWFNGVPFENTYSPMLHLIDASVAWITGASVPRAYNFVTGLFYALGPVFVFLFAWRISHAWKSSFCAALVYSLFSPVAMFSLYRQDLEGPWHAWRLRGLLYYGEGPHTTVLCFLPLSLLFLYRALTTRKYGWCVSAGISIAFLVLTNAFAAVDLAIGAACLVATLPPKEVFRGSVLTALIAAAAYLFISPFLTPTLIRTISQNSEHVAGFFPFAKLFPVQMAILGDLIALWFLTRTLRDSFLRFCVLFASALFMIVALDALSGIAAFPQPHRYSLEMEIALSWAAAFSSGPLVKRLPRGAKYLLVLLIAAAGLHQLREYRHYALTMTQRIDVSQTTDYHVARWLDEHMHGLRVFVSGETGTWLNAFVDSPQMYSGHVPFNPDIVLDEAAYSIYSDQNAGDRGAQISTLWLQAFGCQAIHVSQSRLSGQLFAHPHKFEGVLPLLWREGAAAIYAVPQRSTSLAHVIPASAPVLHQPVNGLDTDELSRYVAAIENPVFPEARMTWRSPGEARIETVLHPGEVISVQSTYDPGWVAIGNGRRVVITRDGLGMSVIHPNCDGPCSLRFVFEGGAERRVCQILSFAVAVGVVGAGFVKFRRRNSYKVQAQ